MQYSADIHNGTLNLDDTIGSGFQSVVKPDTSHTAGNSAGTTGILP